MNSNEKDKKANIQLIIDNERKAMFLPVNDKQTTLSTHTIITNNTHNIKDLLIFDDKKIFYNSNIRFNR